MRWACSAALGIALLACGGAGTGGAGAGGATQPAAKNVPFADVATSQQSNRDLAIVVATSDATQAPIARLFNAAPPSADRALVAAFQGEQRTGGFSIRITKIERSGDELIVRVAVTRPAADAMVTQVITSPAHAVSVLRSDIAGARVAVLIDANGAEMARSDIT